MIRVGMQIEDLRALLNDCPRTGDITIELESDVDLPGEIEVILTDGYESSDGLTLIARARKQE